jgi:threonyl-tRNA synthetase
MIIEFTEEPKKRSPVWEGNWIFFMSTKKRPGLVFFHPKGMMLAYLMRLGEKEHVKRG